MGGFVDSFGVGIGEGDYLASFSTRTGMVKLGHAEFRKSSLYMTVVHSNYSTNQARSEVGSVRYVLRKADGTVPAHIIGEAAQHG